MSDDARPRIIGFSEATTLIADTTALHRHVELRICDWCHCPILLSPHDEVDRLRAHADWHGQQGHTPPRGRAPGFDEEDKA